MLRLIKIWLMLSVGIFAILGAIGNLTDWSGTVSSVEAVTTMGTFENAAVSWRAISNPLIVYSGAIFIPLFKTLSGLLCLWGTKDMWTARGSDGAVFQMSKSKGLAGCGLFIFMIFAGWIIIAETWYELWRSEIMIGPVLGSAFRYCGIVGLIALFVHMRDD